MAGSSGKGQAQTTMNGESSMARGNCGSGSVEPHSEASAPKVDDAGVDGHMSVDASGGRCGVVVFDEQLGREESTSARRRLVRYQTNPRTNWGPMMRARRKDPKAAGAAAAAAADVADAAVDAGVSAVADVDVDVDASSASQSGRRYDSFPTEAAR